MTIKGQTNLKTVSDWTPTTTFIYVVQMRNVVFSAYTWQILIISLKINFVCQNLETITYILEDCLFITVHVHRIELCVLHLSNRNLNLWYHNMFKLRIRFVILRKKYVSTEIPEFVKYEWRRRPSGFLIVKCIWFFGYIII